MSDSIYPGSLPGLAYSVSKKPRFKTLVQEAASGYEVRASTMIYPRWAYSLKYEFLRSATVFQEFQTLVGFFLTMRGMNENFRFLDPDDYTVTGQAIGSGNGTATQWQMVRTFGGYTEITKDLKDVGGFPIYAGNNTKIYLNGVFQAGNWQISSAGILQFDTPPGNGVAITSDFSYYWRCRFLNDELECTKFSDKLWAVDEIEFETIFV